MTRKLFYLLLIPVIILGVLLWSPQKNVNASQVDRKTKLELQAYLHDTPFLADGDSTVSKLSF